MRPCETGTGLRFKNSEKSTFHNMIFGMPNILYLLQCRRAVYDAAVFGWSHWTRIRIGLKKRLSEQLRAEARGDTANG